MPNLTLEADHCQATGNIFIAEFDVSTGHLMQNATKGVSFFGGDFVGIDSPFCQRDNGDAQCNMSDFQGDGFYGNG